MSQLRRKALREKSLPTVAHGGRERSSCYTAQSGAPSWQPVTITPPGKTKETALWQSQGSLPQPATTVILFYFFVIFKFYLKYLQAFKFFFIMY